MGFTAIGKNYFVIVEIVKKIKIKIKKFKRCYRENVKVKLQMISEF